MAQKKTFCPTCNHAIYWFMDHEGRRVPAGCRCHGRGGGSNRNVNDERGRNLPPKPPLATTLPLPPIKVDFLSPTLGMMKWIPPGAFIMGSSEKEVGRKRDEMQHKVTLTNGFWMMEHEVTQGEWKTVMGNNPSYFSACGSDCPVEQVNWEDIQIFIQKVSARDSVQYRLPTEAEWEYAACGGEHYLYSGSNNLSAVGWYNGNSENKTHPVCQKQPNGYDLYDMSGNVFEWIADWYGPYNKSGIFKLNGIINPHGSERGSFRILRGGSWGDDHKDARVVARNYNLIDFKSRLIGFRLSILSI